ncbi:MAG: hypothetical protein J5531_07455 [Lachnospiraceae bacterium]|nr:hypothetical protein [Lachnospiraceae bacterium]
MVLKRKSTSYGLVEVRQLSSGWYGLYVNDVLKKQSTDLDFIVSEFEKY